MDFRVRVRVRVGVRIRVKVRIRVGVRDQENNRMSTYLLGSVVVQTKA